MEVGVPTSFIPHDATTALSPHHYEQAGGLTDLLTLLAVVSFVASSVLGVGTFFYLQYLTNQSMQMQNQIKTVQASLDTGLFKQMTRLDTRMNSAETLLESHIAPSSFFTALNATTLTTVSFQSLSFDAGDPKGVALKMSGIARDVNSVALQADLFGKSGVITDSIFSGIDQHADGVHFSVSGYVNPAAINYTTLVTGQPPAGVNQLPATSTSAAVPGGTSPYGTPTAQTTK